MLTKQSESNYPFANERFRAIFRHTLWVVPGVKAAQALSALLKAHPVFSHFAIVNVAGAGDYNENDTPNASTLGATEALSAVTAHWDNLGSTIKTRLAQNRIFAAATAISIGTTSELRFGACFGAWLVCQLV